MPNLEKYHVQQSQSRTGTISSISWYTNKTSTTLPIVHLLDTTRKIDMRMQLLSIPLSRDDFQPQQSGACKHFIVATSLLARPTVQLL